jgi:hypothetical protein
VNGRRLRGASKRGHAHRQVVTVLLVEAGRVVIQVLDVHLFVDDVRKKLLKNV